MEKENTITIPIEEYKMLLDIKSEQDYEEEVQVREKEEKEYEVAKNTLLQKMFGLCVELGDATKVVNTIIEEDPGLVCEVFDKSNPIDTPGELMDFLEGNDYEDPITGETYTLSSWIDFFHTPEDYGTVEVLHNRCIELYNQKQDLLNKIQKLIEES